MSQHTQPIAVDDEGEALEAAENLSVSLTPPGAAGAGVVLALVPLVREWRR